MLWADALSINQKDMEERTPQVLLMRRIYLNASSVRIDLGDIENNWYPGFDLLNKLSMVSAFEGEASSTRN